MRMIGPAVLTQWVPFATYDGAFSPEECDRVNRMGADWGAGTVRGSELDPTLRNSRIGWISPNDENAWLYDKLAYYVESVNSHGGAPVAGRMGRRSAAALGSGRRAGEQQGEQQQTHADAENQAGLAGRAGRAPQIDDAGGAKVVHETAPLPMRASWRRATAAERLGDAGGMAIIAPPQGEARADCGETAAPGRPAVAPAARST